MLISFSWLKKFIPLDADPHDVAYRLTMAGLEVDVVEEKWGEGWEDVVVVKVEDVAPFPGREGKLVVGKIFDGNNYFSIVSADVTIKKGEKLLGVVKGKKFDGIEIKSRRFGEYLSEAMLIAAEDLGWEEKSTRLLRFSDDLPPGTGLKEIIEIPDTIIEVEITPNRGDCLSHLGVARELKAIFGLEEVVLPEVKIDEEDPPSSEFFKVIIDSPEKGPYYTGRYIDNVKVVPSPLFVQAQLAKVGVRSISNIVDITNFVLMELGQPLHAFDATRIGGKIIRVRSAREGEKILLLDGTERELSGRDLVIADEKNPVALAGIMGGEESGVNESTGSVILESAYFNPVVIRHTARRLGIQTDASYRFERGVDPLMIDFASDRASYLIQKYAGGRVHRGIVKAGELPYRDKIVELKWSEQEKLLGLKIEREKSTKILVDLGCRVAEKCEDGIKIIPPSWRYDLDRSVDLVEEVARIYGYDQIPVTYPAIRVKEFSPVSDTVKFLRLREYFTQWGFNEVINYSFIPEDALKLLGLSEEDSRLKVVRIVNPLTSQNVMRTTLLPGMLENLRTNLSMQFYNLKLFEIGKVYFKEENYVEEYHLSLAMTGKRFLPHWGWGNEDVDFYDLKGVVEAFLERVFNGSYQWREEAESFYHPYQQASLWIKGEKVGNIGQIHPEILQKLKIKQKVYYGEINLTKLFSLPQQKVKYREISKFPAAERDLAVVVPEDLPVEKILRIAKERAGDLAWDIRIFDLYRGEKIPPGKKSVGIRFYFQSREKTLTEEEISEIIDSVLAGLAEVGGELRE